MSDQWPPDGYDTQAIGNQGQLLKCLRCGALVGSSDTDIQRHDRDHDDRMMRSDFGLPSRVRVVTRLKRRTS